MAMGAVALVPLRFERLRAEHFRTLYQIEQESYPDPWSHGMFLQEITNRSSFFYVTYRGEELVGYGGFWLVVDEAHITKVTVTPAFRRQGLGRRIMDFLLRQGKAMGATYARLEVREHNPAARNLYDDMGFQIVGERKGYYARSNETAIVMVKTL